MVVHILAVMEAVLELKRQQVLARPEEDLLVFLLAQQHNLGYRMEH
jgi:hypothetical protein